jgi:resuscitation-promoting factor RpfB
MPLQSTHSKIQRLFVFHFRILLWILVSILALSSCSSKPAVQSQIKVTINLKEGSKSIEVNTGSTVQNTLEQAGITLNNLDKVEPASYTVISSPIEIKVTRVTEKFDIEESIISYERQTVRNESLPEGQTLLIQPGVNGIQRTTFRVLLEDGSQVSRTEFKNELSTEPLPEIVMVGVQTPFTPVSIPGRIAYLTAGNAWVMENSTGERHPVVSTGDLDGRVFTLSQDSSWLLYTRKSVKDKAAEEINTLWMVNVAQKNPQPIFLRVKNVIHFADWMPGKTMRVAYSTVEPRPTAPGWQANNDLILLTINDTGGIISKDPIIEPSSGGIYGWWGTKFFWSKEGRQLAYARPDSVGLVDIDNKQLISLLDLIPYQTRSDWAWVPGLAWSPDGTLIYSVAHTAMSGLTTAEVSPLFDLTAIVVKDSQPITIIAPSGMFAYPVVSSEDKDGFFQVAYLQAIFPEQSETSRYRLMEMDRDGSNRKAIFPPEGSPGIDPQQVLWGPNFEKTNNWLAFIYQGNLWLVNPNTGKAQQITGDGSIGKIDWK